MFYRCPKCGNIIYVVNGDISRVRCCGVELVELHANDADAAVEKHVPYCEVKDNKINVTIGEVEHPMDEDHYIEWIAMVRDDKVIFNYLKPGDSPKARFCYKDNSTIYAYCNKHGLWKKEYCFLLNL